MQMNCKCLPERDLSEEDLASQSEKVSGEMAPLYSTSEDTSLNISEGLLLLQTVEVDITCTLTATTVAFLN